jgi:hypothetical protein
MSRRWTASEIAGRLARLVDEHGAPNHFQIGEVTGDHGDRAARLAVAGVVRLQAWAVNDHLKARGLAATYHPRRKDGPAHIGVERIAAASK